MTYIDLINAFEKWSRMNYLAPSARVLYYKFLALFNACGWPEWITVGNPQLIAEAQIGNEKSTLLHRDKLISVGLLDYQKGRKGAPNRYRLNTVPFTVNNTVQSTVKTTVKATVQSTDIPRYKTKEIDIPDEEARARNDFARVYQCYEQNMGAGSRAVADEIVGWMEAGTEAELICGAIETAAKQNVRKWSYVAGILRDCCKRGIFTRAAFDGDKAARKAERQVSAPQNTNPFLEMVKSDCSGGT